MNSKRRNAMKFSLVRSFATLRRYRLVWDELKFEGEKYAKVRLYRARLRCFA